MATGIQMVTVTVSHSKDKNHVIQLLCGIETWQGINIRASKGRGRSRDELGIVVRQSAQLFASPWQERRQSAVWVVWDADHVPIGPHLQTD